MSQSDNISKTLNDIERACGELSIGLGKHLKDIIAPQVISTGSLALNLAIGIGGLPRGRVVELFGEERTGKTSLALLAIAQAQRSGGRAAFIDAERGLDLEYADALGVDVDELVIGLPANGEHAFMMVQRLVADKTVDMIAVDSVSALSPMLEPYADTSEAGGLELPRLMSQQLRQLSAPLFDAEAVMLFTNQKREKPGEAGKSIETTSGGNALRHHASIRIGLERVIADGKTVPGRVKARIEKNKFGPVGLEVVLPLSGKTVAYASDLLRFGLTSNLVTQIDGELRFEDVTLGETSIDAIDTIAGNEEISAGLEKALRTLVKKGELNLADAKPQNQAAASP